MEIFKIDSTFLITYSPGLHVPLPRRAGEYKLLAGRIQSTFLLNSQDAKARRRE